MFAQPLFHFPGCIASCDHCRNILPDQQICTYGRSSELGGAHPLVKEAARNEVLARDEAIGPKYFVDRPPDRMGPKRIMEGPIFLENRVHDRVATTQESNVRRDGPS